LRGRSWKGVKYHRAAAEDALSRVSGSTAALLIGDSARAARGKYGYELDLAEAWAAAVHQPMVFAVWAIRKGRLTPAQREELLSTFQRGIDERRVLARSWIDERGIRSEKELRLR